MQLSMNDILFKLNDEGAFDGVEDAIDLTNDKNSEQVVTQESNKESVCCRRKAILSIVASVMTVGVVIIGGLMLVGKIRNKRKSC